VRVARALGADLPPGHRRSTSAAIGGSASDRCAHCRSRNLPPKGIPSTYVPARNSVFLALGMGVAEVLNAAYLYIGVNAVDYSGYPDCRPEFIEAFQGARRRRDAKRSVEGAPLESCARRCFTSPRPRSSAAGLPSASTTA
jgi:7-cyano-7-deazaguanine synthase in queuosine biosynthesis